MILDRWRKRKAEPEELAMLHYLAEIAEPDQARRLEDKHRRLVEESGEIPTSAEHVHQG